MKNYIPYGIEWEKEMEKLPKHELIKMLRKAETGTKESYLVSIRTAKDAGNQVEEIINDFECGNIDKPETLRLFGEYTGRIMGIFWENAKIKFEELAILNQR